MKTTMFRFILQSEISSEVTRILDAVFTCTLEMINRDMEDYPEHRINFFTLLQALMHDCFAVLIELPSQLFRLIVDAVVWAFKHTMRNVAEIGMQFHFCLYGYQKQSCIISLRFTK